MNLKRNMRRLLRTAGFTLIEMAILVTVVGLVIGGAFQVVGPVVNTQRGETTIQRLAAIQKALQVYVIAYGCLPCPANGALASLSTSPTFGQSLDSGGTYVTSTVHCTSNNCATTSTVVPWRSLGLSEPEATDGWGNRIRYYVANGTTCNSSTGLQSTGGMVRCSTSSFPAGGVSINDFDVAGGPEITTAAYVLVSSGPDGALALRASTGASTADTYGQSGGGGGQDENFDGDAVFASGGANTTAGTAHYDDLTRFATAPTMIALCGSGACGNPS
jgi:type II secretory pathway pseudopilin PulG